jgi:transcriptional regulator with XRE-family HTH domain
MSTNYAKAFRVIRAAHGWQQADMAQQLGIGASQLSLIESGKRQPSMRVVGQLASVAKVPTALIVLLASDEAEVVDESISSLAMALLKLLVAAGDKQQRLPLEN